MTDLTELLDRCVDVHADLAEVAAGVKSIAGRDGMPRGHDPLNQSPPGDLSAIEHRHLLLRGLRWWVAREGGEHTRVGQDVAAMARYLADHVHVMTPNDRTELASNLTRWLRRAYRFLGDTRPNRPIPREALGAKVAPIRVADAAALLGCTVRTIRRRVPPELRPGGMVRLRDAVGRCRDCGQPVGLCDHTRCQLCDLILGQCSHTHTVRTPRVTVAQ